LNFVDRVSKNLYLSDFMNIQRVGAELFQVVRETGRRALRNYEANNRL